ncbi:MAG TPA: serine/threonine-protein kinase [Polyangiaceae bacterium]|nr:serine/threonine-protein kinase [Polyangiaceae bacterium]
MNQHANTAEFDGTPSIPAIGEVIAHKYRVTSVVGTGGMGVVLSATHIELGQSVAIKVLTIPEDDTRRDEARERFLREGRATAALVSDHVVRVYDVGTLENGAPFMVMELLRGKDLAVVLQQNGALSIEQATDYVRQAAEAIASAHAQGIVHRDLKPSNLFLTQRSDGTALIKVLDFGISKTTQTEIDAVTGNLTAARSVLGTPFYMSPEQIRDAKKVDFRTDIWSLGLILHELLSGSPAFEGGTLPGVCAAIAADPPAALRLKRPEVSVELEAIVLKCLEKDPARRFQDVRDLAAKLVPWSGRPESGVHAPLSDKTIRSSPLTLGVSELRNNPTLAVPGADSGTMASAVLTKSGERLIARATPAPAKQHETLAGAPEAPAATGTATATSKDSATRRSLWLVAGGLIGLVAIGVWVLRGPDRIEPRPAPSAVVAPTVAPQPPAPPVAPASGNFSLQIDSNPVGAQVYEHDNLLGSTPLHLSIDAASVAGGPRTFTLRKAGFASYTIVQSASPKDTHVLAELDAELHAAPGAPSAKPKKAPERKPPSDKPKPSSPPSDIFMQR